MKELNRVLEGVIFSLIRINPCKSWEPNEGVKQSIGGGIFSLIRINPCETWEPNEGVIPSMEGGDFLTNTD